MSTHANYISQAPNLSADFTGEDDGCSYRALSSTLEEEKDGDGTERRDDASDRLSGLSLRFGKIGERSLFKLFSLVFMLGFDCTGTNVFPRASCKILHLKNPWNLKNPPACVCTACNSTLFDSAGSSPAVSPPRSHSQASPSKAKASLFGDANG
ncbi:Hypothetical predicted protein [Olea europaea subsp. europaea]|uniref:Uncharacterized protein n=1 Tax=Olea europaea subsp. europaea TaxID=158383 RepID=A0A8S0PJQ3_OLEEU|nr:Hypothetical predicted protein [Olea europaea subsp. europaea]